MYNVDMLEKGMIQVLGEMEQDSTRFHYTTQKRRVIWNVKIVYFWNFPSNVFGPRSTTGNWNHRKETVDQGNEGDYYTVKQATLDIVM